MVCEGVARAALVRVPSAIARRCSATGSQSSALEPNVTRGAVSSCNVSQLSAIRKTVAFPDPPEIPGVERRETEREMHFPHGESASPATAGAEKR